MGKQVIFLIDTEGNYSVLPSFSGKPSSQTAIVVGVDGQKKLETSLLLSLAELKLSFLCIGFL
jgi:hypothetical protein